MNAISAGVFGRFLLKKETLILIKLGCHLSLIVIMGVLISL
jgi:hypothetical protein